MDVHKTCHLRIISS